MRIIPHVRPDLKKHMYITTVLSSDYKNHMYRNIHQKKPLLFIQTNDQKAKSFRFAAPDKSMCNIQLPNESLCLLNTDTKPTSKIENTDSFQL